MILVFDLDDTLVSDFAFRKSAAFEIACFLEPLIHVSKQILFKEMILLLQRGHQAIFDRLLEKYGIFSKKTVASCLRLYRAHAPQILLRPEAKRCLERFFYVPKYLVTDGNHLVQRKKVQALHLEKYMKRCLFTRKYGIKNEKPSAFCFQKICAWEKVKPEQVVYIGDNPYKDFVGIKPLGFHTVRVKTGIYKDIVLQEDYEAEVTIASLDKLDEKLLTHLR